MKRIFGQKGEGRIGLIITLVIIAIAVFVAYKIVPVKVKTYEFRDTMREEARMASLRKSADETMQILLDKAKELGLPITRRNLVVNRTEKSITIKAKYMIRVDFKVYVYDWAFDQQESAPLF
ncbi:MAG: hypothetical protein AB1756_00675 [Acidobacteriota bacterium]